ncbi:unnamed protein product [Ectocarpus sp. 8 AP-2014]
MTTPSSLFSLICQGKHDEAEPLYVRAIAIGEKALGPEHPDLAVWLNNRGMLMSQMKCQAMFWKLEADNVPPHY